MKYVSLICLLISLNAFMVQAQNNRASSAEPTFHFKARKDSLLLLDSLRISIKSSDGSNNKGLVPIAESVVLLSESLFGHQHPEFAKDMNQYAVLLWRTGAYQKADSTYAVCEMILGNANLKDDPIYANVRGNHGNVLQLLGKIDIAENMMLEALQIYEHIGYKDSLDYLTFIGNLGTLYVNKGQFKDAVKCFEVNQKGLHQLFGPMSLRYALATNNLGSFYGMLNQFDKSEQLLLEAKNIYEVNNRTASNGYGRCVTNLGLVHFGTGRVETALDLLKLGLKIREQVLGPMHPEVLLNLANLANFYQKTGQFAITEQYYQELLRRYESSSINNTPEYGALLGNLSGYYRVVGRYKESIDAVQKGIHICENTIGKHSPKYADLLQLHGIILKQMGSLNESKDKMRESLLIYKETKGENSLEYAIALHNISDIYLLQDSLNLADKYEQASLDIYRIISDTLSSPYLAIGYKNLGSIRFAQKSYNASERYYNIACNLLESIFGKDNYELAECLQDLALCQASAGSYVQALDNLRTSGNIFRQFLTVNTETMSEHEAQSFLAQFDYNLNRFFSTLYGANQSQTETVNLGFAYDNVLFYKAFLLQFSASRRQKILSLNDAEIKSQYLHWLALQRQLFKAYEKPLKDRGNIDSLEIIVSRAEKEVLSKISELRLFYKTVSWKDVQSNLTNGEAAVEFVKFPAYADSIKYAALILRPEDSAPKFIPLFEAETLKSFLRGASGGSNFLKINELYSQKSLYDLLWKPLEPHLKGINTVYCAPSGLLHRLNLAAISTPEGQVYGQRRQLVVLGSTRSLAIGTKASQLAVGNSSQAVPHDAYLAGGIRYDSDSILVAYASRGDASRSGEADVLPFQPDSLSITRGGVLEYLPATAAEVRELSQTLRSAGYQTQTDTGFYATEESFRRLGTDKPSPRVVHLATHGYFFPDPAVSKKQLAIGNESVFKMSDHPMIRSGLILAGAKQAWLTGKHPEGQEDGILTAYEISQMNLGNTELVVLSACETGLGDIVGNEGVYGLQRAFKIAGARYLIMSLWKVDDQSTRAFMSAFYRHWLTEKQSVPQAFRSTQQEMQAKYAGAYDWAGFVLIE